MKLLLGSGGFNTPERRKAWIRELDAHLGDISRVLFIPYALTDHDAYLAKMLERGFDAGRGLDGIHRHPDPVQAVREAQAIFVGGGNSFRLLHGLQERGLIPEIRARIRSGAPYVGISAGTNMACPTLKTTNDMPIVQPSSFEALGLVPFQINPHYFAGPIHFRTHAGELIEYAGETRDDRIREFHEMNDAPVLGLWEGSILRVDGNRCSLTDAGPARGFEKGAQHADFAPGTDLSHWL